MSDDGIIVRVGYWANFRSAPVVGVIPHDVCRVGYVCAHCEAHRCWTCEAPISDDIEVKTIGGRFCDGCVEHEAPLHGLTVERMREKRARRSL